VLNFSSRELTDSNKIFRVFLWVILIDFVALAGMEAVLDDLFSNKIGLQVLKFHD